MNYQRVTTETKQNRHRFAGFFRAAYFVLFGVVFFANAGVAHAGFGITPPYVTNDRLTRGTTFEQRITLVRSDPVDDLKVQITKNIPGIESWFEIDRGNEFIMPKGTTQMPIVVTVHVPQDAEYKVYTGAIRIRTSSADVSSGGGVSIALGAQIDVSLTVVDKIYDFNVRRIRLIDLEEGFRKWSLFFPGKIRFFMTIENTGNTEFGPTKVQMDIYDIDKATLLESIANTNKIDTIAPFAIKEVLAELPTRVPAGRYIAKYTIFKNNDIAQQNEVNLSISALGAVPGYEGYGFDGLNLADKIKVALVIALPLIALILVIVGLVMRRRRMRASYGTVAQQ
ncbi:MAG: hypothetical protein RLZZ342_50 [Candidatus Parcubacteria bacterium]|jgi:hypothetical protein